MPPISYARHKFPPVVIQHAVWLYVRFTLSYQDVEDLLAERGLDVSYESIRRWVLKFGPAIARRLRQRRLKPTAYWHLDEMVVQIAGKRMYLWRAVDSEGEVLDIVVQGGRDKAAALKLMRQLLKKQGFAPTVVVTDKLRSYAAAFAELGLAADHERGLRQNNREFRTGPPARAKDAAVQVSRFCSALPRHACRRPQHVQCSTPSDLPPHAAPRPSRGDAAMARSDDGRLTVVRLEKRRTSVELP